MMTWCAPQQSFLYFAPGVQMSYLAVPKVASRSVIAAMLAASYRGGGVLPPHSLLSQRLLNRRPVSSARPDIPVFTVVRDPVDRFVSFYANKFVAQRAWTVDGPRRNGFAPALRRLAWLGFDAEMSLDDAVGHLARVPYEDMDPHGQPQWRILTHRSHLIPDFVLRLETIDESWDVVATLSGCDLKLSKNSSAAPRASIPEISDEGVRALESYYAGDYTLLDYPTRSGSVDECDGSVTPNPLLLALRRELDRRQAAMRALASSVRLENANEHFDLVGKAWERFIAEDRWGAVSPSLGRRACYEMGRIVRSQVLCRGQVS